MKWSIKVGRLFGIIGLLTLENISDMIMVNSALGSDGREGVTASNRV